MSEPVVGSVLGGKYVIEGILGRGGMGVVVAARHRDLDQRVAIKCLLPHALGMPDVVERFGREARAAARIQGEHVARVIDVGRFDDGTPFMVMEYLQGHDLSIELHRRGTITPSEAVRYVLEACEAVAQAHATRIVHRDLKPSNLFLAEQPGRRPIVKVLDFGISKIVDPAGSGGLTKTASVMGTPFYMSPEQLLSSKNVDKRSDIWSLGVILYELLVGSPPFVAETAPEVIAKILQNAPIPPRAARPEIPPGLEAVILRCMRTRAEERYRNVAELAAALLPFGSRANRESVDAIARVLGVPSNESLVVSEQASTESTPAPRLHESAAAPVPARMPTPAAAMTPPTLQSGQGASPMTAHDLAVSSREVPVPARRAWALPAAVAAALVVAGGGIVVVRARTVAPVAGVTSNVVVGETTASSPPMPSVTLAALAGADPAASTSSPASAGADAGAVSLAASPVTPNRTGRSGSGPSQVVPRSNAVPVAPPSVAPPPAPPPSPPPAPTAPPTATASKNPLDLQLK